MNAMLYRLLKRFNVGSKCCFTTLLWSLAAWILFLQVYKTLFPSSIQLPEPRTPWGKESLDVYDDPEVYHRVHKSDRTANIGKEQPVLKGQKAKTKDRFSPLVPLKNKVKNKVEEEARELAALQKLALLFPGRRFAIDPLNTSSEEHGYFYPGREWRDTEGKTIQAHGGGILYVAETRTFYWYGENKGGPTYHFGKHGTARVSPTIILLHCPYLHGSWVYSLRGGLECEYRFR